MQNRRINRLERIKLKSNRTENHTELDPYGHLELP